MLAHVTLTGQLAMLMLIEQLMFEYIQVLSANTDGITVKCLKSKRADVEAMVTSWCAKTGFTMDYEYYKSIHYLNVNNYFYQDKDGHMHGIGFFADDGIRKNQDRSIVRDACFAFVQHGTPVEDTIFNCTKIASFLMLATVTGGAVQNDERVGKVIRFYTSTESEHHIHRAKATKSGAYSKIPNSDNAVLVNDLPDEFPCDVDYERYIIDTYKKLLQLGLIPEDGLFYRFTLDDSIQFKQQQILDDLYEPVSFGDFIKWLKLDTTFLRKIKMLEYKRYLK